MKRKIVCISIFFVVLCSLFYVFHVTYVSRTGFASESTKDDSVFHNALSEDRQNQGYTKTTILLLTINIDANESVQRMAWPLLCTLPKGRAGKNWTPQPHIRMFHAKGVCIATFVDGMPFPTSPCFLIRTISKRSFPGIFGKVRNKS